MVFAAIAGAIGGGAGAAGAGAAAGGVMSSVGSAVMSGGLAGGAGALASAGGFGGGFGGGALGSLASGNIGGAVMGMAGSGLAGGAPSVGMLGAGSFSGAVKAGGGGLGGVASAVKGTFSEIQSAMGSVSSMVSDPVGTALGMIDGFKGDFGSMLDSFGVGELSGVSDELGGAMTEFSAKVENIVGDFNNPDAVDYGLSNSIASGSYRQAKGQNISTQLENAVSEFKGISGDIAGNAEQSNSQMGNSKSADGYNKSNISAPTTSNFINNSGVSDGMANSTMDTAVPTLIIGKGFDDPMPKRKKKKKKKKKKGTLNEHKSRAHTNNYLKKATGLRKIGGKRVNATGVKSACVRSFSGVSVSPTCSRFVHPPKRIKTF